MKNKFTTLLGALAIFAVLTSGAAADGHSSDLKSPQDFNQISDEAERSAAIFTEMGKVITHPRCINCHPRSDIPTQGDRMKAHQPKVIRGESDFGATGLQCNACHGEENVSFVGANGSIPGAEHWLLAPKSMGWVGLSLPQICEQLKDPERNGDRTPQDIVKHVSVGGDVLVAWGWNPGDGREPVPGDQETFGALTQAWVDTGAHCPK